MKHHERLWTSQRLLKRMAEMKKKVGTKRAAAYLEVTMQNLNKMLHEQEAITPGVAWHLGYERVERYRRGGKLYTLDEVREHVLHWCFKHSKKEIAERVGVHRATLLKLVTGKTGLKNQGAKKLGYEKVWRFRLL